MFRLNTIVTIFRIENVDLSGLNQYLFEIDWNINRQGNWLPIQCDIDDFLYFIDDDGSCVIEMHNLESLDKKFNDFLERNLSRYRWQNRRRKSCFRTEKLVCFCNATMTMNTWRQATSISVPWHCRVFTLRILFREPYGLMLLRSAVLHNSPLSASRALM